MLIYILYFVYIYSCLGYPCIGLGFVHGLVPVLVRRVCSTQIANLCEFGD